MGLIRSVQVVSQTAADYGGSSFWFGTEFKAEPGTSTAYDFRIAENSKLFSGSFYVEGAAAGDVISFQVVDVDGVISAPGTVLSEYVDDLRVVDRERRKLESGQAADLVSGIYLRTIYESAGASAARVLLDWQVFR